MSDHGIRGVSGVGNAQEGGTQSFRFGALKRRLKSIPLFDLSNSAEGDAIAANTTFRLLLKGLTGVLNIHIACGVEGLRPSSIPAGALTMQLIPINNFPDANGKIYLREVFQDPTATNNADNPLPQDCPYGWEGSTEADQIEIQVTVNVAASEWSGTNLNGRVIVQATVEYNGQWWDQQAIQYALSQVTLEGEPSQFLFVATSGE